MFINQLITGGPHPVWRYCFQKNDKIINTYQYFCCFEFRSVVASMLILSASHSVFSLSKTV